MGRKEKQKAKVIEHEDDDVGGSTPLLVFSSDDDEEANQDLSLKIVEKALRMRAAKQAQNADVLEGCDGTVSISSSSQQQLETAVVQNDDVLDGPSGIAESEVMEKNKTKLMVESGDHNDVTAEEQETVEAFKATENDEPVEASMVQMGDNIVLRKLLRGPRYFDPPDSGGWGTCYNCGQEGHAAVNCTAAKRRKPCYVCGDLGHSAKQCTKAQDCFICKKGGHRARDCPEKHRGASKSLTICLKCGISGHDMFSCKNDYSLNDLEGIQCYVCKRFGHLCCVNSNNATPGAVSCYKCGQLGHTGLACSRLRVENTGEATLGSCYKCGEEGHFARECTSSIKACSRLQVENIGEATPGSCYKCGEEGHFARECTSSIKACSRLRVETTGLAPPGSCYKCGEEGHFARECTRSIKACKRHLELSNTKAKRSHKGNDYTGYRSAPYALGKSRQKKGPLTEERGFTTRKKSKSKGGWMTEHPAEERGFTTPKKSKSRGGWMTDHPGEFSPSKSKRSIWRSTATPSPRSPKIYSFSIGSHTPSSNSSKVWNGHAGTSKSQGFAKAHHHIFSASRFGNSNSGHRKSYNWW